MIQKFDSVLEKSTGIFVHAASLATEQPLSIEDATTATRKFLWGEPVIETTPIEVVPTSKITLNDYDKRASVLQKSHAYSYSEINATNEIVDEIIFDAGNSPDGVERAAKIGSELLAIIEELATKS